MKKIILLSLSFFISVALMAQSSAHQFAVKSAKLEIKMTGSTQGIKTIFFDDYGDKYYEEEKSTSSISMFGITEKSKTHTIEIINNGKFWTMDKITGKNYKGELPFYNSRKEWTTQLSNAEQEKIANDLLKTFGGERLGKEKVLGKNCEKIRVMGTTIWVYNGLSLKSNGEVMGVVIQEEATNLEENISISSQKFAAPKGVNFVDLQTQQGQFMSSESFSDMPDYEEDIKPLNYPYTSFTQVINKYSPQGYTRAMMMNEGEQYMALYTQGFSQIISIVATAYENMENIPEEESKEMESFTYKGKTLYYGRIMDEDMDGTALIIPYKKHQMNVVIMCAPGQSKDQLLEIADDLDF